MGGAQYRQKGIRRVFVLRERIRRSLLVSSRRRESRGKNSSDLHLTRAAGSDGYDPRDGGYRGRAAGFCLCLVLWRRGVGFRKGIHELRVGIADPARRVVIYGGRRLAEEFWGGNDWNEKLLILGARFANIRERPVRGSFREHDGPTCGLFRRARIRYRTANRASSQRRRRRSGESRPCEGSISERKICGPPRSDPDELRIAEYWYAPLPQGGHDERKGCRESCCRRVESHLRE